MRIAAYATQIEGNEVEINGILSSQTCEGSSKLSFMAWIDWSKMSKEKMEGHKGGMEEEEEEEEEGRKGKKEVVISRLFMPLLDSAFRGERG